MKNFLLASLSPFILIGCFFGGEGDSPTGPENVTPVTLPSKFGFISPGDYHGDYTWTDSNFTNDDFETEFILNENGTFNLYWLTEGTADRAFTGNWAQKDSSLHILNSQFSPIRNDLIGEYSKPKNDTNAIRNVTDTSFSKAEFSPVQGRQHPLASKPYWITYTKQNSPKLTEATYQIVDKVRHQLPVFDFNDTARFYDTVEVKSTIQFKGQELTFTEADTVEQYQFKANWKQIGTMIYAEKMMERIRVDSTRSFSDWDSLPGVVLWRLREQSDTNIVLWNPILGSWISYHRLP